MMDLYCSLFIVESPFQLLSAIEANNYFNDNSTLIVKYNTEKENDTQLKILIKRFSNFNKIIEIISLKSNFDANVKLFYLLKKLQNENKFYDNIFIGEYRSFHMRKFFDVLNPTKCYLLDDGNITISMAKYISSSQDQYYFSGLNGRIKQFLYISQSLYFGFTKYKIRRDIAIFTCFNIDSVSDIKIINHNFKYFKSLNLSNVSENIVYFYGSNLKELGIEKELEIKYLRYVLNYYQDINLELVYIAHRKESVDKLDMIKNILNIKVIKNTYPAEVELILDKISPRHIGSFVSSVLVTLPTIYNFDSVVSFFFPSEHVSKVKYKNELKDIKNEYKKSIKVIEMKIKEAM